MRTWLTLAAAAALSASAYAANPFSDVPRTHWAYKAISRAVDAGVLEGYDGKFHGEKLINRYQMAVIVKRVLDNVGKAGGPSAAGMSSDDVKNLEAGLRLNPSNKRIHRIFKEIGRRKPVMFSFLSRKNPLNVWIGRMRETKGSREPG